MQTTPKNFYNIFAAAVLSALLSMNTSALAAGSSSVDVPKSQSGSDLREKANVHFQKGKAYEDQQRFKEATQEYEKAIDIDNGYAEAYSNLGFSYRKQGRHDDAIRAYKRAIDLKPGLAEAHEYLGEAYAETKQFSLAEKHLDILKRLDPDEAKELEAFIQKMKR
ncbi:MAG: tetratricopeptide repeat protein [Desulfatitalea sp.]